MKKICFVLLVVLIGTFIGCDNGSGGGGGTSSTNGSLTITGIPAEYNEKYAVAGGMSDGLNLVAAKDFNLSTMILTGGKISNGSVTLKIWKNINNSEMAAYSGNDEGYWLSVSISNNEAILGNDMQNLWVGDVEVDFTNGVGSGTFESLD